MRQVLGMARGGHIEDRSAVGFLGAGQRIERFRDRIGPAMVADMGDPAPELLVDYRLLRAFRSL